MNHFKHRLISLMLYEERIHFMHIDCVFSGGGVKAYAFLGAYDVLEKQGYNIKRVAGTSAGAIFASLIAAEYTAKELHELMQDLHLKKLLDPPRFSRLPLIKWMMFYFQKGLYKGDRLEQWIQQALANKNIHTFADLQPDQLKVVISDISLGKLVVLPDDLKRVYNLQPDQFSVATAVRMSASFPYFFMPQKMKNRKKQDSYMVDGGLLSNFPLWIFRKSDSDLRPVLGITLSEDLAHTDAFPIQNAFDMLHALFMTMQRAHDTRYIAKSKEKNIIFIPVKKIAATDLTISEEKRDALMELGTIHSKDFLKSWP